MMTKQLKSEQAEPMKAMRQDITLYLAQYPTIKILEAIASAVSSMEALLVICLTTEKDEMLSNQIEDAMKAQLGNSEPLRANV